MATYSTVVMLYIYQMVKKIFGSEGEGGFLITSFCTKEMSIEEENRQDRYNDWTKSLFAVWLFGRQIIKEITKQQAPQIATDLFK